VISVDTFPNTPASVTRARHMVTKLLSGVARDTRDSVEMLVSEVATNCVRHTSSEFTVRVDVSGGRIRVDVTDGDGGRPRMRSPAPTEPSGRGLRIVDLLSDRWGVTANTDASGKTVWFEVAVPAARSA
jgi:serine/threonine-protein kinase RsbW